MIRQVRQTSNIPNTFALSRFSYKLLTIDPLLEDFLMTYIVFLPVTKVCPMLISYFKMLDNIYPLENDNKLNNRRKVVYFVKEWCDIAKDAFYEDPAIMKFMQVDS